MIQFYGYDRCESCRKARRWLEARGIACTFIDITADPPEAKTLRRLLDGGTPLRKLFNTAGGRYRALGMKDRLHEMSEAEALDLLAGDGMLVKRPIVVDPERATVGFDPETFEKTWGAA